MGDRITFKIIVSDSKRRLLPPGAYFQFSTPYDRQPIPSGRSKSPNPKPLVTQMESEGTFQALRSGTVTITGQMGDRVREAKLTIK